MDWNEDYLDSRQVGSPTSQCQERTRWRFHQGHLPISVLRGCPEVPGARMSACASLLCCSLAVTLGNFF